MPECRKFQLFGLACLIMAVISGIVGFIVVYHYTQFQRPIQQFAIVIDAGSTQTRSSLFSVGIDTSSLIEWSNEVHDNLSSSPVLPLTKLFQIRQVDTCVNGGPVANIKSPSNAKDLASKCIKKFSKLIKKLDFESESDNQNNEALQHEDNNETVLDSEEVGEQMALLNHRVNSVTHLYLGATAGMRAIEQLNATRAAEKIHWIDMAINESSQGLIENGPYINKAYVGILEGSDEAAFGWTSVNFVCDTLEAHHRGLLEPSIDSNSSSWNQNHSGVIYSLPTEAKVEDNNPKMKNASLIESVGTLELGGASIQLAYQVSDNLNSESLIENANLQRQNLDLFNNRYNLATRSDLCLGMSQAILRAYYVLLWQHFRQSTSYLAAANEPILNSTAIEIENPCLQKAAQVSFTKEQLRDILNSPCLSISNQLKNTNQAELLKFNNFINSRNVFRFSGLGKTIECDAILWNLIEPNLCKNYFFICPDNKIKQSPPISMPFVTISGYNKALQVLNLPKKALSTNSTTTELEQIIADKLGGYSIDHDEFSNQMKTFCSIDVAEFPKRFPKMNKLYYGVNCLQLIYINKLLIEFYGFKPETSWNQLKFLIFPVKSKKLEGGTIKSKHQDKNDIGWTLGLLLNATSHRFSSFGTANGQVDENEIYFHHGATTLFLIRTTIFLMFACCLLAICCIFIGAIVVHHQKQTRSGAYMIHNSYGGTSSAAQSA